MCPMEESVQWEYKFLPVSVPFELGGPFEDEELTKAGDAGWEAVGIVGSTVLRLKSTPAADATTGVVVLLKHRL